MDITRTARDGLTELAVDGRIDSYWADHLDAALAEVVRAGQHRVRVELSRASFLSSAGVGVLVKYYKQLTRLNGALVVSKPSDPVRLVLEMTRVAPMLVEVETASQSPVPVAPTGRQFERGGTVSEVFGLTRGATLSLRTIGHPSLGGTAPPQPTVLPCPAWRFALGVGALGDTATECRDRFGELLAVSGAAVYQPADGTNVPDYLVGQDTHPPEPHLLYGLGCDGSFASLVRFDATTGAGAIGLSDLAAASLEVAGARAAGVVIVADTAALVGAALRRSPLARPERDDLFAHPAVRANLTFTAERAFAHTLVLCAGIVATVDATIDRAQLRPLDGTTGLWGHFHAAAFPFHPFKKGEIDLHETVAALFDTESVLGVLHLLHDDRGPAGAGQSEFVRGACWVSPIAES
jgi:anti-anti-sigma factor